MTGGVDTLLDVHVAAALDERGALLEMESFEATAAGENKLGAWLASFGPLVRVGVSTASKAAARRTAAVPEHRSGVAAQVVLTTRTWHEAWPMTALAMLPRTRPGP